MPRFPFTDGSGRSLEVDWSTRPPGTLSICSVWTTDGRNLRQVAIPRELAPRVAAELWPEVVEVLRALKPHAASHCQRFPGDGLRTCETTGMPRCFACAARHALAQLEPPEEG